MNFRDYQLDIIDQGISIILKYGFVYLGMEVRTGKTLTSLGIAQKLFMNNVLFVTKKKAISSIESDYKLLSPKYKLIVINYESLHKIPDIKWDMIICDEAHSLGAFPKPNKRARDIKDIINKTRAKVVLLSGTPTPESYSQIYHQVYGIKQNPFNMYVNFYKFAHNHVRIKERKINGLYIRDYSHGLDEIIDMMNPYTINFSQKEAGFKTNIKEKVLYVDMEDVTYDVTSKLKRDKVVEGEEEVVLADTPVKLMMKLHQLYSGTIKFESGNKMVLDYSKAEFIKDYFKNKKIAIFYKFTAELEALKIIFDDSLTTSIDEFKKTKKNIALQIVSGREGISLKEAKHIVYYNIDFSATSYWQSRDRMTTKNRLNNSVYWIFSKGGIEDDIYKAVTKKKDYTVKHFKRDLLSL
tara:strand:+ start:7342 stop:8571 length:1230 start_codon:yes stop_codon:yes gene_type:complete